MVANRASAARVGLPVLAWALASCGGDSGGVQAPPAGVPYDGGTLLIRGLPIDGSPSPTSAPLSDGSLYVATARGLAHIGASGDLIAAVEPDVVGQESLFDFEVDATFGELRYRMGGQPRNEFGLARLEPGADPPATGVTLRGIVKDAAAGISHLNSGFSRPGSRFVFSRGALGSSSKLLWLGRVEEAGALEWQRGFATPEAVVDVELSDGSLALFNASPKKGALFVARIGSDGALIYQLEIDVAEISELGGVQTKLAGDVLVVRQDPPLTSGPPIPDNTFRVDMLTGQVLDGLGLVDTPIELSDGFATASLISTVESGDGIVVTSTDWSGAEAWSRRLDWPDPSRVLQTPILLHADDELIVVEWHSRMTIAPGTLQRGFTAFEAQSGEVLASRLLPLEPDAIDLSFSALPGGDLLYGYRAFDGAAWATRLDGSGDPRWTIELPAGTRLTPFANDQTLAPAAVLEVNDAYGERLTPSGILIDSLFTLGSEPWAVTGFDLGSESPVRSYELASLNSQTERGYLTGVSWSDPEPAIFVTQVDSTGRSLDPCMSAPLSLPVVADPDESIALTVTTATGPTVTPYIPLAVAADYSTQADFQVLGSSLGYAPLDCSLSGACD